MLKTGIRRRVSSLIVCLTVVAALGLIAGTAQADPIKVTLACPATITPGGMLNVSLTMQNTSQPPATVTISKSAVAAHLANLNVIGPFTIPLFKALAPGASFTVPGYLVLPFPDAPHGTFSSLGVAVLDSANQVLGGNGCLIEVQ